jgi:hypothetical protein
MVDTIKCLLKVTEDASNHLSPFITFKISICSSTKMLLTLMHWKGLSYMIFLNTLENEVNSENGLQLAMFSTPHFLISGFTMGYFK